MPDTLHQILFGFKVALQPFNLLYCFVGVLTGTLVGILPGLGVATTISLLLPMTYRVSPISAIIMLAGIYYGAQYGGSTTSILLNIPGESTSVVTCIDGYKMARNGRAGAALGISAFGSFIAGTLGIIGLMFFAPTLANFALKFGTPEYFSLLLMSLSFVTFLSEGSMLKSLIMVGFGLILGAVGMDIVSGKMRFVYGIEALEDGLGIVPVVMGLFGISEILLNIGRLEKRDILKTDLKNLFPNLQDWKDSIMPIFRGTFLGFLLGVLPGFGAIIPTFLSYGLEKRISKHPEKFGTGVIEGVAAPESCNNAASQASFIPLLSFGIPSNAIMALLLGALLLHGIQPGPLLIRDAPELFWGVVASMYVGNTLLLLLNLPLIPLWVSLLRVPYSFLFTFVLLFCAVGAYSLNNSISDVLVMIFFGIIGYLMKRLDYDAPPFVLAFILGPMLENALRQSLIISNGSFSIFFTRPISALFIIPALIVLVFPILVQGTKMITKVYTAGS